MRSKPTRRDRLNRDLIAQPTKKITFNFWEAFVEDFLFQLRQNDETIRRIIDSGGAHFIEGLGKPVYDKLDFTDAKTALEKEYVTAFNKSGQFSSRKLGFEISFKLTNPNLLTTLRERTETFPESSKVQFETTANIIEKKFIEQGLAPYDKKFYSAVQNVVGDYTEAQAVRFARTETGLIAMDAEHRTYQENGVEKKEWITATFNVRPTHAALNHKKIMMNENFNVGGNMVPHPMHWTLPPEELINCRCDILPIFEKKEINKQPWSGQ